MADRLSLNDREWKEFKVGELFTITSGRAYNKNKMKIAESGLRHISRATSNHGIDCYADMEDYDRYDKYLGNCITVSSIPYTDGTCAFYQDKEFCCGVGVGIIRFEGINKYNSLFICNCINAAVIGKYGMAKCLGPSALRSEVIYLPADDSGNPDYDFMERYVKQLYDGFMDSVCVYTEPAVKDSSKLHLTDRDWKEFKVEELFVLKVARSNDKGKLEVGDIPFIGRSKDNNGLQGFYSTDKVTEGKCITLGMVGTFRAFWQDRDFAASQNILTIRNSRLNKCNALFICKVIETAIDGKYSYGNSIKAGTFGNTLLKLPADDSGNPDYDFMEQYIKQLPFSKGCEL